MDSAMDGNAPDQYSTQSPVAHRVLAIVEILRSILIFSDNASKASCARVCKEWFDSTIPVLWKRVRFHNTMSLLAPVQRRSDEKASYVSQPNHVPAFQQKIFQAFSRLPTPRDWTRFQIYSVHVKQILCFRTVTDAVAAIALSRPMLHIFPDLQRLEWRTDSAHGLKDLVLLMVPTITHLDIQFQHIGEGEQDFDTFCEQVASRLPNLRNFHIGTQAPSTIFAGPVARLISTLKDLEKCTLPKYGLTSEVVTALSRLPKLHKVASGAVHSPTFTHISNTEDIDFDDLEEGAFGPLNSLQFTANSRTFQKLLEHAHGPHFLVSLVCDTLHNETPTQLRGLIKTIAATCPALVQLALIATVSSEDAHLPASSTCKWSDMRPILQCRNLTALYIRHSLPLNITEDNLIEIAHDRSTWTKLKLAPSPAFHLSPTSTLPPSAILHFSHCPRLENLGLFINGDLQLTDTTPDGQLPSLSVLEIGCSQISQENIKGVGMFLAGVCAIPVKIETVRKSSPEVHPFGNEVNARRTRWKQVEDVQNEICKARWVISLREESVRLRKRVEELESRLRSQKQDTGISLVDDAES